MSKFSHRSPFHNEGCACSLCRAATHKVASDMTPTPEAVPLLSAMDASALVLRLDEWQTVTVGPELQAIESGAAIVIPASELKKMGDYALQLNQENAGLREQLSERVDVEKVRAVIARMDRGELGNLQIIRDELEAALPAKGE